MAKYEVIHSCSHPETVNLIGPSRDRERKLAWLEQQACPVCMQAERIKVAQGLAEMQAEQGLPSLIGSEKQITWATQIRHEFFFAYEDIDRRLEEAVLSDLPSAPVAEQMLFELDDLKAKWSKETYAQAWIDHRSELSRDGISSQLRVIRDGIADRLSAPVTRDFPLSDADKREVLKLAVNARRSDLEQKRAAEAKRREEEAEAKAKTEAAREQEKAARIQASWAVKDEIAAMIPDQYRPASLTVWNPEGRDKRVYFESGRNKVCLFVVGNKYNRPGSLVRESGSVDPESIRPALEFAAQKYKLTRFEITREGTAR